MTTRLDARRALGGLILIALMLSPGCDDSPEARHREHLNGWYREARHYGWSCDALGERLQLWIEEEGFELSENIHALIENAQALPAKERQAYLSSLSVETPRSIRETLARCQSTPSVQDATAALASRLQALMFLEPGATTEISTPTKSQK